MMTNVRNIPRFCSFSAGKTSALVGEIVGLENFELISALLIQSV